MRHDLLEATLWFVQSAVRMDAKESTCQPLYNSPSLHESSAGVLIPRQAPAGPGPVRHVPHRSSRGILNMRRRRHRAPDPTPYRERRPLERLGRRADFATRTNPFRASLTATDVGKAAAFSGLRTTTFEPAARRAAYFPRVKPAGKSERL